MQTEAAILWEPKTEWSVESIELDPPKVGRGSGQAAASGMCHSDEHLLTGDLPAAVPIIGGHEGGGVVAESGRRDRSGVRRPRRLRFHSRLWPLPVVRPGRSNFAIPAQPS